MFRPASSSPRQQRLASPCTSFCFPFVFRPFHHPLSSWEFPRQGIPTDSPLARGLPQFAPQASFSPSSSSFTLNSTSYLTRSRLVLFVSSYSSSSFSIPASNNSKQTRTCKRCKIPFDPAQNHDKACLFHSASWIGAENSKHYGTGPQNTSLKRGVSYFYDCCGAECVDAPGCTYSYHVSYDD